MNITTALLPPMVPVCITLGDLNELEQFRHDNPSLRNSVLLLKFRIHRKEKQLALAKEDGGYRGPLPSFQCQNYVKWLDKEIKEQREGREQRRLLSV